LPKSGGSRFSFSTGPRKAFLRSNTRRQETKMTDFFPSADRFPELGSSELSIPFVAALNAASDLWGSINTSQESQELLVHVENFGGSK
jgi:hypothetical protein